MASNGPDSSCYRNVPSTIECSLSRQYTKYTNAFGAAIFYMVQIDAVAHDIVTSAFRISTILGPGLLESVYETVLARDLVRAGHSVERQKWISFDFEGLWFEDSFRLDLLVDRSVAVEIKSAKELSPAHYKQLLTYLKLTGLKIGLLINFGQTPLKIKRIANGF